MLIQQGCKARKIRCEDPLDPPCKACRSAGINCEQTPRQGKRRARTTQPPRQGGERGDSQGFGHLNGSVSGNGFGAGDEARTPGSTSREGGENVEDRLARIEEMLNIRGPSQSRNIRSRRASEEDTGAQTSTRGGRDYDYEHEYEYEGQMAPPRFQLDGNDHPVYHGETSMYEDGRRSAMAMETKTTMTTMPVAMTSSPHGMSGTEAATEWSEVDLRRMTRMRHKYASAEEGESWMDAYFCWASPTYAVVNRQVFLREYK
jgi:hypothetical protein